MSEEYPYVSKTMHIDNLKKSFLARKCYHRLSLQRVNLFAGEGFETLWESPKRWHTQRHKVGKRCWKMVPVTCGRQGCHQPSICKRCGKARCSLTLWYPCNHLQHQNDWKFLCNGLTNVNEYIPSTNLNTRNLPTGLGGTSKTPMGEKLRLVVCIRKTTLGETVSAHCS